MFIQILSAIHNAGTLLFGIYCSAFFLGVKSNKKNIIPVPAVLCSRFPVPHYFSIFRRGTCPAILSFNCTFTFNPVFIFLLQVSSDFFLCFGFLRISLLSAE